MKVTPRKEEVEAVLALLEDDTFADGKTLAKAIIKQVGELFGERDWYAWVWRETPESWMQLAHGPYSSSVEVDRAVKRSGLNGQHMALKLYSVGAMNRKKDELPSSVFCGTCGHPDHCHEIPKYNGRCWIKGCGCKKIDKTIQQRVSV